MIKVQNQFDRMQNSIVNIFYLLLRVGLSVGLGFLSSQCVLFEGFSPFSLILLSVSPNVGLIPTFCYLGGTFGTLFNPFDLSTFKYITALTMLYVIYMIFQKSLRVIKRDTAVLTAACCFTSGFLFLLVGQLNLFNMLVLIGESVLICCCIYFVNYATKAFRKCCYLSAQEIIALAITLILIIVAMGNLYVLNLSIARIFGLSLIFLAIHCLKVSHTIVLGTVLSIILSATTNGGEAIFASIVAGTLAGCVFTSFSERFSIISFIIVYYATLFFFGKFPWSYWYFTEPLLSHALIMFIPKSKLRSWLSSYIAVKSELKNKETAQSASQLLHQCYEKCKSICPKAEICYNKNEQELLDTLSKAKEQLNQAENIENININIPFCIKKTAMSSIIETQLLLGQTDSLDNLIDRLDRLTKDIDRCIYNETESITFHEKKEKEIYEALQGQKLLVKDISFISRGDNTEVCSIVFEANNDVLYENIIKKVVYPYFKNGAQIHFKTHGTDITAHIKDRTTYSLECSALCKTKDGEAVCGDQAIGFSAGNKYFLLLADGMGCGKEARIQSDLIIKTLKKLIIGGLSVISALNTYRSILRINEAFGFSTIDICSIDLNTGNTELYKAGAYDSFLISKNRCFLFAGGGIPIGLSETDNIKHETIQLHHGDYLILASDGLIADGNQMEQLLLKSKDEDVRSFAKKVLYTHSGQSPYHGDDDVTIMICKIKKTEV